MSDKGNSGCVVCGAPDLTEVLRIDNVPVFCNVQWPEYQTALDASVGDIHLGFCANCGHVFNQAFDIDRMDYSEAYENSLHFSSYFHQHAEKLADRLIEKYSLREKTIVEIGCGKGEFISLLCEKGGNRGYGFDRSYEIDRSNRVSSERVTYSSDYYSERHTHLNPDFVCCRHVLEHIPEPVEFLKEIRKAVGADRRPVMYFEVPNLGYSIQDMGIWDFIYEHCSYFDASSLQGCFINAGFEILDSYTDFGNQFLCIEAIPREIDAAHAPSEAQDITDLIQIIETFTANYNAKIENWNAWIAKLKQDNKTAAIWGAGSKGITFLNTIDVKDTVRGLVDLNPNKQGLFAGGTGHEIVAPERLRDQPPDYIVIMNSVYREEITALLSDMNLKCEIVCA